jgi:hypothetical protein
VDPKPPTRLATTGYLVVTALLIVFLAAGVILAATAVVGAVRGDHTVTLDRVVAPEDLASLPANETGGLFAPPIGGALLFGLAVLVLAEVFAHGLRLREDVEGTI